MTLPACPKCQSEYTYTDAALFICPECAYEWQDVPPEEEMTSIKDAHGQILHDGDTVIVIKDLKVKGASSVIKGGTKVKNIRVLHEHSDGHDIDCKIEGFGAMKLKSIYVKKV